MTQEQSQLDSLSRKVGELLLSRGWYLTTVESCTGGWVSQVITATAGSSQWFDRGFVTYTNQAKQDMVGVSGQTLEQYGAVSENTVLEMVDGAIKHSAAQCALAISGIAGPGGGTAAKPVGTVCFAWMLGPHKEASTQRFQGERETIRLQSVLFALQGLVQRLQN